jgi:hypothetical protein
MITGERGIDDVDESSTHNMSFDFCLILPQAVLKIAT